MKIVEYTVENWADIQPMLDRGYELWGSPIPYKDTIVQAMVKYEEPPLYEMAELHESRRWWQFWKTEKAVEEFEMAFNGSSYDRIPKREVKYDTESALAGFKRMADAMKTEGKK